jgi:hypothetical protein
MTTPTSNEDGHDPVWRDFARRHAEIPFLQLDALYALSEPIIDAIKQSAPGFFSPAQERFERDLVQTASFGFFHQRPLGRRVEPPPTDAGQPSLEEREQRSAQQIKELLSEEMRRARVSPYEISEYFSGTATRRKRVDDRQDAYAGWLVTNPDFHREARALRKCWGGVVRAVGRFPTLPMWFIPDVTADMEVSTAFREELEAFYCRWGLERMRTWDWPVPMEADFVGGLHKGIKHLPEAGMTLFVPWFMLRGERISLKDVARLARLGAAPEHLSDWVNSRYPKGDDLGETRYAKLLWLYRFHELVLMRRYGSSCQGNIERLDYALATVLERDQDSVKKLRLHLRQAMDAGAA